jgi:hypothetical protein
MPVKKTSAGELNSGARSKQRRQDSARVCEQTFNLCRPRKQPNQLDKATSPASEVAPAFGWLARH